MGKNEKVNINRLIIEYVAMCEKYGLVTFDAFIELWLIANLVVGTERDLAHAKSGPSR